MTVGTEAFNDFDPKNPTVIQDIFGRVGGPDTVEVSVETMITIFQDNVILDNIWLWRADHNVNGLVMN